MLIAMAGGGAHAAIRRRPPHRDHRTIFDRDRPVPPAATAATACAEPPRTQSDPVVLSGEPRAGKNLRDIGGEFIALLSGLAGSRHRP